MKQNKKEQVKFKDLSTWLKIAYILALIGGFTVILEFIIGFIIGIMSAL